MGKKEHQDKLVNVLLSIDFDKLTNDQKLGILRAYALTFIRMGKPDDENRKALIAKLDPKFPANNDDLNTELLRVLVYLNSPGIIEKSLALIAKPAPKNIPQWQSDIISRNKGYARSINKLLADYPPVQKLGYAFMLRNLKKGLDA